MSAYTITHGNVIPPTGGFLAPVPSQHVQKLQFLIGEVAELITCVLKGFVTDIDPVGVISETSPLASVSETSPTASISETSPLGAVNDNISPVGTVGCDD